MESSFASLTLHPRDRLPQIAPRINLKPGRFWFSTEEFNGRVEETSHDLKRIKAFSSFTTSNYRKIREHRLMSGDVRIFPQLSANFLEKEFVDPKKCLRLSVTNFNLSFF